jgi:tRNA nucleotidyltransferase/poly(A) polymerase
MITPPRIDANWLSRPETAAVFAALERAGHGARAVGGSVRNALIGRPVADVDIATTATPAETMRACSAAGLGVHPTGLAHGTVTIVSGGIPHEVTTLRRDVETFGRHATVAFTDDWREDAARRDFTINALYCDARGVVHDPLGGYPDLLVRRVRFIGDPHARIREDFLRILRFFRFTAEYAGGRTDDAGLRACGEERTGLGSLSAERVRSEFMKVLVAASAPAVVRVMHAHGFLAPLLGLAPMLARFERMAGIEATAGLAADPILRCAALAIRTPEDADRLTDRLRLSNVEHARLVTMAKAETIALGATREAVHAQLYRLGRDRFVDTVLAQWSLLAGAAEDGCFMERLAEATTWTLPRLPIDGRDVIASGIAAGPAVGAALRRLEDEWLASGFRLGRDALLELLHRR